MPAWRSAVTSPWTALTSRPTRRAISRIDNSPWPVIALRISQRFLVRVFQSRSTESNEMCAHCSSPRNAAAARRETSSREAPEAASEADEEDRAIPQAAEVPEIEGRDHGEEVLGQDG